MSKKILVLVLSTNMHPYRDIETLGQDTTWKQQGIENVKVMRYFSQKRLDPLFLNSEIYWNIEKLILSRFQGNKYSSKWKNYIEKIPVKVEVGAHEISSSLTESYSLIGLKTVRTFEAILKLLEFDYVYRTNISSYVDLNGLSSFVGKLDDPDLEFFGGAIGTHNGYKFASGSGYLIGRNLVEKAVESKAAWDHSLIDDVALSKLLFEWHGVEPVGISRIDLNSILITEGLDVDSSTNFHYRCKTDNYKTTISIMKALDKKLSPS